MCGIAGFIGQSTNPKATFALSTSILTELKSRGEDATGFWGTQAGTAGKILYHKEGIKSTEFVKKDIWAGVEELNPDLMIFHARAASIGVGTAYTNKNNHPFSTPDRKVGLVHNGRIPDTEYDILKKKYETESMTDSEILLRIFEAGALYDEEVLGKIKQPGADNVFNNRIRGIRDIWAQAIRGAMAVAIGERIDNGDRRLWLFRNHHRPCWLFDLRKELNQIFFCSTPEIWTKALEGWKESSSVISKKVKMFELPTEEVWIINTKHDAPTFTKGYIQKHNIGIKACGSIEYDGTQHKISKDKPPTEVYTRMDSSDYVKPDYQVGNQFNGNGVQQRSYSSTAVETNSQVDKIVGGKAKKRDTVDITLAEIKKYFKELDTQIEGVSVLVHNQDMEGSLKSAHVKDILETINVTDIFSHTNMQTQSISIYTPAALKSKLDEFRKEVEKTLDKIEIKDKASNMKQEEYKAVLEALTQSIIHFTGAAALLENK